MAARRAGPAGSHEGGAALLTPARIPTAWSGEKLPRAVLLAGPETALREEALACIRKLAFADGDGGLSWVVLHGPQNDQDARPLTPADVLDELRTRPLFGNPGEPKVVVVRQAELLLSGGRTRGGDEEDRGRPGPREVFESNLDRLPSDAVLVLEVGQEGTLKSTRFYKALAALGGVVDCGSLREKFELSGAGSRLADEVLQRGAKLGLALDHGAAGALIERVGEDLGVLAEELAKLSLTLGATPERRLPLTEKDIARLCASSRLVNPFEFAEAVANRNARAALEALHAVFAHGLGDYRKPGRVISNDGQIAMRLMGALNYKLTQLQDLRAALDHGAREFEAFGAAKVFGPRQDAMRRTLRLHTSASLRAAMASCLKANLALRTGAGRREVLETFVWEVCGTQGIETRG